MVMTKDTMVKAEGEGPAWWPALEGVKLDDH